MCGKTGWEEKSLSLIFSEHNISGQEKNIKKKNLVKDGFFAEKQYYLLKLTCGQFEKAKIKD